MLKALIGMLKWKIRMKKLEKMEPFTDQWWKEMEDSLVFVPPEMRSVMFNGMIMLCMSL